jgi:PKD repeat protein
MSKSLKIYILLFTLVGFSSDLFATHSMGMDLTYECVSEDVYHFKLSFYRDCEGVNAPNNVDVDFESVLCGENFTVNFAKTSFAELNAVCASLQTTCGTGTYPGIEEHIYEATVTMPAKCIDWSASTAVCCRNNAINTVINPGDQDIFVKTTFNNVVGCNNSPIFAVNPVPFMCATKSYCFNNGAADIDGDSLVYSMITPTTGLGGGDTVQYIAGYNAQDPITSSPAFTFDEATGDFCMTPIILGEVSVMQVLIEEYRNGVKIGSVERDIQLRVINCPNDNNLPFVDGINSTGDFSTTICAGEEFTFNTNSVDIDATNSVVMSWNSGIVGAAFDISAAARPVGTFTWTPTAANISSNPYCFTVEVVDDNCPFLGSQVFSFCIEVVGVTSSITSSQVLECNGACDGQAVVLVNGGVVPYTYQWDNASNGVIVNNLCAGDHSVTVTDNIGCFWISTVTLTEPDMLVAGVSSYANVMCAGMSSGYAVASAIGGIAPYAYNWSNGTNVMTAAGLSSGNYTVTVTDDNNCEADTTIIITEPTPGLSASSSSTDALCKSGNSGAAQVNGVGGTAGYTYDWDIFGGIQTTDLVTGLSSGIYQYTVTDNNGCLFMGSQIVGEPLTVITLGSSSASANCFGASDGSVTINSVGGNSPYSYQWDNNAGNQITANVNGLALGNYNVSVTDNNQCLKTINVAVGEPIELDLDVTETSTTCGISNGSASIAPSGGTVPYTILWSTADVGFTITGQSSGLYTLTVTDNKGCVKDTFAILNDLTPSSSVVSTTNLACYKESIGEAQLTVSGGLTPYAYSWTDGQITQDASGLYAGVHFVTVKDVNLCINIHPIVITEPTRIIITTDSAEVKCFGGSDGLGAATADPAGGVSGYTYQWDASAGNQVLPTATGLGIGIYTVTVSDGNSCKRDTTIEVTQPTAIVLDTASVSVLCNGESTGESIVIPSGGRTPYGYVWDVNTGNQTDSIVVNLVAGTYYVTVSDNNGCLKDTLVVISESTILETDTLFTDVNCYGESNGSVQVNTFGGKVPYDYLWSEGSTVFNVVGLSSSVYNLTVVDANNCTVTNSVFVPQPANLASSLLSTAVKCFGGSDGTAAVTAYGGVTPYSFVWSEGNVGDVANNIIGGFQYVTITDFNSCTFIDSVEVDQPDAPLTMSLLVLHVSCFEGNDGSIAASVSDGTTTYSYSWSGAPANNTNKLSTLNVGTYGLTVTDLNSCTVESSSIEITEPNYISFVTDSVRVTCFGQNDGEALVGTIGGSEPYFYEWNTGQTTVSITGQLAGTYSVTVVDEKLCLEDTVIVITEPDLLELQEIVNNSVQCTSEANGSAQIEATGGITPYIYQWGIEASFQPGQTATSLMAGTYAASVTDVNGCAETIIAVITEPDSIAIITTPQADTICPGGASSLGAFASGGNGNFTYHWDNSLGNGVPKSVAPSSTTIYHVWVEDGLACLSDSAIVVVNVIKHDFDSLQLSYDDDVCKGIETTIHSSYFEEFPPYNYQWNNGLGTTLGDKIVTPQETTTYILTITDQCNNKLVDSLTVIVFELPVVVINISDEDGCQPLDIVFSNTGDASNVFSYDWSFGDGFSSTLSTSTHTYSDQGTFEVTLIVTTNDGCVNDPNSSPVDVVVNPKPQAGIKLTPQVTNTDDPNVTFISQSFGEDYYNWDFGDYFDGDTSTVAVVEYAYQDTGTYEVTLIVENIYGCTDTVRDIVVITPAFTFEVPNVFTPDPSGPNGGAYDKNNLTNNVFIPLTDYINEFHLEVFNRWGELIFETFDIKVGWDGYYKGGICQQDVYVWKSDIVYIDGTNEVKVGEILLLR